MLAEKVELSWMNLRLNFGGLLMNLPRGVGVGFGLLKDDIEVSRRLRLRVRSLHLDSPEFI